MLALCFMFCVIGNVLALKPIESKYYYYFLLRIMTNQILLFIENFK